MIENFREIVFPENISYGSSGGPSFKTSIFESNAGYEQRNIDWKYPKHTYEASHGIKTEAQMDDILSFFYGVQGKSYGFRFKDWNDYIIKNQSLGTANGVKTEFQINKLYTFTQAESSETYTFTRKITKPVWDTVSLTIDGSPGTEGVDYDIDYTTGIVTFAVPPNTGIALIIVYAEFHVPVRFDTDHLDPSHEGWKVQSWQSIPIIELRDIDTSIEVAYTASGAGEIIPPDTTSENLWVADFKNGVHTLRGAAVTVTDLFTDATTAGDVGAYAAVFDPALDIVATEGLKHRTDIDPYVQTRAYLTPLAFNAVKNGATFLIEVRFSEAYDNPYVGSPTIFYSLGNMEINFSDTNLPGANNLFSSYVKLFCDEGSPTDLDTQNYGWHELSQCRFTFSAVALFARQVAKDFNHKMAVTMTKEYVSISLNGAAVFRLNNPVLDAGAPTFLYLLPGGYSLDSLVLIPTTTIQKVTAYPILPDTALPDLSA